MSAPPSLSICVPAYNRLRYLPELVASVEAQWRPGVELCVSDNGSDDGSPAWLDAQSGRLPWLRWESRGRNVGPDRNYLFAVGMARGRHAWLMGSDDALAPGGLAMVLDALKRHDPDIVLTGFTVCDLELCPLRPYDAWTGPGDVLLEGTPEEVALGMLRRANHLGSILTYLSNIVVRTELWNQTTVPLAPIGGGYVHTHLLLRALPDPARMLLSWAAPVLYRLGNDSFAAGGPLKRRKVDLEGLPPVFRDLFPTSDAVQVELFRLLKKDHMPERLSHYLAYRMALTPDDWRAYAAWLRESYGGSWRITAASLAPVGLLATAKALKGGLRAHGGRL